MKTTLPLILASGSKVRANMLKQLHLEFEVIISGYNEEDAREEVAALPIAEQALHLANGKAQNVSAKQPNKLILAADQICEFDGTILCKPGNAENAQAQLSMLSGKTHYQHSAACLYLNGKNIWEKVESATMTMRQLTEDEISTYVALDKPFSSCGSYMLEHHGKHLFSAIDGQDDVIKGLPTIALLNTLFTNGYLKLTNV